ncbi:CPBP family intramembrane glutamic endopeptidase [Salinibacterium hongtaonis]|uniref:CPBP family intramembrane glutamic endopeptidase n=1 Tax=Homoserinimonas hongtaonis TaxID=2079791 RepID=UPI000D3BB3A3|nr:CPBP family intramembrane glutamic endopeptidase [Salinibacterium hongtaonis]AWB89032.1 hypothetical protein C2138_05285 [Salinibacterium hongtaonis]
MHPRSVAIRRPYAFVALMTLALILLLGVAGTMLFVLGAPGLSPVPLVFAPVAIAITLWAWATKRWHLLGFRAPRLRASTALTAGITLAAVLALTVAYTGGMAPHSVAEWLGIVGLVLLVAFVEETLFRSIFIAALAPKGILRAVIVSSVAFALAHSVNALSGQDLETTVRQIIFAVAFGLAAGCIYVRTASIWPTIAFHALFNFVQLASVHQTPAWVDWVITTILIAGAAVLWIGGARQDRMPAAGEPTPRYQHAGLPLRP